MKSADVAQVWFETEALTNFRGLIECAGTPRGRCSWGRAPLARPYLFSWSRRV